MTSFTAIADPNRRKLLDCLLQGPQSVNSLVSRLQLSQPLVSKHLKVLRNARLVAMTPSGRQRLYSIEPGALAEIDAWLLPYRRFWADRLDHLESHLAQSDKH